MASAKPSEAAVSTQFDDLVARHAGRVYGFVRRLAPPDQVEDLAQEVWIAAFRAWSRYRHEASEATWLLAIAHRVCAKSHHRRRRRADTVPLPPDDDLPDAAAGPEQAALAGSLRETVRQAVDQLPETARPVVHLARIEGLDYATIARILGIPIGTVRSRLHHGMRQLAVVLAAQLETDDAATTA